MGIKMINEKISVPLTNQGFGGKALEKVFFQECTLMWSGSKKLNALLYSPNQKRMHSHVVLITFWNALSSGPFQFLECTLM